MLMNAMLHNLDISLLRCLLHVAATGSMTAAANRLHMTQGAVSQQVKRLEEALNLVLLERGKNGVRLTSDGERLLPKARKLLDLHDDLLATMREPDLAGQLRIGVPHDLIGTHLPPILQSYTRRHPNVNLSLLTGSSVELRKAYDSGAIDLALMEEPADRQGGESLAVERPVWVGAVDGEAWTRRPLPICLVSATCVFRAPLFAALNAAGIEWRNIIDYPSLEATGAAVRADMAVSAWLASTVPAHLRILGPESGLPVLPPFAITLHFAAHGASAPCLALAQALRDAYRPVAPRMLRRV